MGNRHIDLGGTWKRSVGGRQIDFLPVPGSYPAMGECSLEREFEFDGDIGGSERAFLCTEGVIAAAAFSINGETIGRAGPLTPYRFEIPRGLLKKENVIRAEIRDMPEPFGHTPGRLFHGGLVRDVYIEMRPSTFIDAIQFRAELGDDLRSACCTIAVELDGPGENELEVVLEERDTGREVARAMAAPGRPGSFVVEWPRLWSPETPNLYALSAQLAGDAEERLSEMVGIRKIEARGRDFYLNGKRLFLKGVCRHEFNAASGYSPSEEEVRRELAMIRHAGFNHVRLVHTPQARCVSRIAAELGLLVTEEPGTCWHNLADESVVAPAIESLRRTVKRDRNVPSIFAWYVYNECDPNAEYALRAAKVCRELDPGCMVSSADCSGRIDEIKEMARAADFSFYGINMYNFGPNAYCERMAALADKPVVFTEWGGCLGQGNPRVLQDLCDSFVIHSRENEEPRVAGCTFWAWADYEEHTRPRSAAVDGWTIEGLVDRDGRPKPDLQTLSMMCLDIDHTPVASPLRVEVLSPAPRRDEPWQPVRLEAVEGDQSALEQKVDDARSAQRRYAADLIPQAPAPAVLPRFGQLLIDGIEFICRDADAPAHPLLLGEGRDEIYIPVGRPVSGIAILGHVAFAGGYPFSSTYSVFHADTEQRVEVGDAASEYEFVFDDEQLRVPLRHGIEVLRANDISRWWKTAPRGAATRPAVRIEVSPTYETLRADLWLHEFEKERPLKGIRWRLTDPHSIQMLFALSVRSL